MVAKILVVSPSLKSNDLLKPPFSLSPSDFMLCQPSYLKFVGVSAFKFVILHEIPAVVLRKLALGIRDDEITEGIWEVLSTQPLKLRILSLSHIKLTQDLFAMGIEIIRPADVAGLLHGVKLASQEQPVEGFKVPITSEEIREMYIHGGRAIEENQALTPWAKEIAETLGMTLVSSDKFNFFLVGIFASTRDDLKQRTQYFFEWSRKIPQLLFVLPTPLFPIFNELFPALRGRLVSPTIHWANQGAFTGEVALNMLIDAGCIGAIVPDVNPYSLPENMKLLICSAAQRKLLLFQRENVNNRQECDIISSSQMKYGKMPSGLKMRLITTSNSNKNFDSRVFYFSESEFESFIRENRK